MILTFGEPSIIQRLVFNINQGKISNLISEKYAIKIISLVFETDGQFQVKPYVYQLHLWQIIIAVASSMSGDKRSTTLVKNIFYTLQVNLKKVVDKVSAADIKTYMAKLQVT